MINDTKMTELAQAEEMAYFRADICCYSPESYTLDEKKQICNDMISSSRAVLDAIREDFDSQSPEFRARLLAMICETEPDKADWWWDVLVGEGDPLYREPEPIS